MTCPACGGGMPEGVLDGHHGRRITLDLCAGCNGIWFDGMESHQLTAGATLALFKQMGEAVAAANRPLADCKACPRCRTSLVSEIDKQRTTTFEVFRCPAGHGRYMTFGAFLRAKNFTRDLTPQEIDELRKHVQSVRCTGCGAAVDVRERSACDFCRAPIAMIDPDQLQKAIATLQEKEQGRPKPEGPPVPGKPFAGVDPALPLRLAQERMRAERVFAELGQHNRSVVASLEWDLFDAGLSSIVSFLGELGKKA
jgi:Zn-finger nucleic acid-binding protein